MQSVLITTDFSHHSKYTIKYVLELFENTVKPCNILLLNSYKVLQTDANLVLTQNEELKNKSKSGLLEDENYARKLITNPLISIETISHMGSIRNVILRILQNENINLLAMGHDGGKHIEIISKFLKEEKKCPLLITYFSK